MTEPAARVPVVSVDRLRVQFGDHSALRDVNFQMQSGAFVAVVGPNGSGKTTLLETIVGLQQPTTGRVRVFGKKPREVAPGVVGYVPQVKTLDRSFPAQAIEVVLSALHQQWSYRQREADREQAMNALARVGAKELAERPVGKLSGGELQRVYLARSLIRTPRLVVLDEPTTGVDAVGTLDLYAFLETYQRECEATVLMVTHDWNTAYHHADQVLVLDGAQVSFGPPDEALDEQCLREAFGHVGHAHAMLMGGGDE